MTRRQQMDTEFAYLNATNCRFSTGINIVVVACSYEIRLNMVSETGRRENI